VRISEVLETESRNIEGTEEKNREQEKNMRSARSKKIYDESQISENSGGQEKDR